jgi:hypothetical protein
MLNSYPDKPTVPYQRTSVTMGAVVTYLQKATAPAEVKRAAYIMFRIESGNGGEGVNSNYLGFQADSGRWPSKFDDSIVGIVDEDENGTGRERLFLAFASFESCLDMLLYEVQTRGIYIGGHTFQISKLNVGTITDLCIAYVREWAVGSATAEPTTQEINDWKSMYAQAAGFFKNDPS